VVQEFQVKISANGSLEIQVTEGFNYKKVRAGRELLSRSL